MEDQLSIINSIIGFCAALTGLYVFIKNICNGKHRYALILISLILVAVSTGVFIYKPITPSSVENNIPQLEAQEQTVSNTLQQEYVVSLVNDTHRGFSPSTKTFTQIYKAKPGYKIIDFTWTPTSVNNVKSKDISISGDGSAVVLNARIEAGSIIDQWRGWLKGRIVTKQVKL